ncbi:site-specific integrase [Rhizobium ruizarguesonis]|uniref:site-specific integrase n=1 Tax=Rhizobium ruizarguesonis TaxID=2081791 RepID=UPI001639905B|nr:site-specific integrase [Rhizobium ruizarguesonis]MBC2804841.1 site-specific integrase [Rhizobium ruizarguesonis]
MLINLHPGKKPSSKALTWAFKPSDFRMTLTSKTFKWFEEARPNVPIIRNPNGTICQPLVFYFAFLARCESEATSSMKQRAYTLREWFAFLHSQGAAWHMGDDIYMHRWRQSLVDANDGKTSEQIELKIRRVFDFYLFIPDAMRLLEDGRPTPVFVGPLRRSAGGSFAITSKRIPTKKGNELTWISSKKVKSKVTDPSVPDELQVAQVMVSLRTPRDGGDLLLAERNWMLGSTMAGGGLRAAETTTFDIREFTSALKKEGLLQGLGRKEAKSLEDISVLGTSVEKQEIVLRALKHFEKVRRRQYLSVKITGKGSKTRHAAFTIDLVRDLLVIGIWTIRRKMIERKIAIDPAYVVPDTIFLSHKTDEPLLPGTVSDIMAAAFDDCGIVGSGHHLRRHHATSMAITILKRTVDNFGCFTQAVLNTVLDEVADALGHSQVNTTTQYYVNMAAVHFSGVKNKRSRARIMKIWELLLEHQDDLTDDRIKLCGTAVKIFARVPKQTDLYGMLSYALENKDINPDGLIEFDPPPRLLRAVR